MVNPKTALAIAVSIVPLAIARRLLYSSLFGYRIAPGAKIGFLTIIAVEGADIEAGIIGRANKFIGPYHLSIGRGTSIGRANEFLCGRWVKEERFRDEKYERFCHIGDDCVITSAHKLDATGGISLGARSWIAGEGSQFWTHGIGVKRRTISIGADCYIGSAARFGPGSVIGDNNLVGLGSVVLGEHMIENALIAGVPARVLRTNYNWRTRHSQHD